MEKISINKIITSMRFRKKYMHIRWNKANSNKKATFSLRRYISSVIALFLTKTVQSFRTELIVNIDCVYNLYSSLVREIMGRAAPCSYRPLFTINRSLNEILNKVIEEFSLGKLVLLSTSMYKCMLNSRKIEKGSSCVFPNKAKLVTSVSPDKAKLATIITQNLLNYVSYTTIQKCIIFWSVSRRWKHVNVALK